MIVRSITSHKGLTKCLIRARDEFEHTKLFKAQDSLHRSFGYHILRSLNASCAQHVIFMQIFMSEW